MVAGTAHEAYLRDAVHRGATSSRIRTARRRGGALRAGEVDLLFGDGISARVLAQRRRTRRTAAPSAAARSLESRYFGEGIGIAVRRGNDTLRQALNWALFRLWEKGRFTDLWLRYFPISPF